MSVAYQTVVLRADYHTHSSVDLSIKTPATATATTATAGVGLSDTATTEAARDNLQQLLHVGKSNVYSQVSS